MATNEAKTRRDLMLGVSSSGAPENLSAGQTAVDSSPVIPSGTTIRISKFGAGASASALVALQWGSGSTWETIRAYGLNGQSFGEAIDREFVGDGAKRLRVLRQNIWTGAAPVFVWVEAFQL